MPTWVHPPVRPAVRAACLVTVLALGWPGCSSAETPGRGTGPEPPSFEPIVFPHQNPGRRQDLGERRLPAEDLAGWKEKWELASRYAAGGYDEEALQILDAALAHDPPAEWAARMRALKTSLRMRRAEEHLLRVEARGTRDYVPFQTAIDFVIRFRNVSREEIVFLAPEPGALDVSPSAMTLEITRRDRDVYATEFKRGWNQTVFLQRPGAPPIRIPPGGVHEVPVRIPAEDVGPPLPGLRVIQVGGILRPTHLRKGGEGRTVRVPIRAGRVVALPGGYEPLVADPLGSMRTATRTVAPIHLLIATEFVPPRRAHEAMDLLARALAEGHPSLERAALGGIALLRERAVGDPLRPLAAPLMDALRRAPGRSDALMKGLRRLTGLVLAPDPRLWQDWWRREAGRRTAVAAAGEDG